MVSEITAASTLANHAKQDTSEELDENIWGESRQGEREVKNEFIGKEALLNYYK